MLDEVYGVLKAEYERQEKAGFNSLVIDGMTGFIFCNKNGKICRPLSINYTIKKITEHYNEMETDLAAEENREPLITPSFTCHHMRHTFCTKLCESETNVKVIPDVMGYASIETTMNIYAEIIKEKKREAFKILSDKSGVIGKSPYIWNCKTLQQTTNLQQKHIFQYVIIPYNTFRIITQIPHNKR